MIRVFLIRHGQSESNAGLRSADPGSAPLTPDGHRQARQIARVLADVPALIVTSPYLRARQTAQPTISRFPQAACQEWPVQEFTYLGDLHGRTSTAAERQPCAGRTGTRPTPPARQPRSRILHRPAPPHRRLPGPAQRAEIRAGRGVHPRAVHARRRVVAADRYHHPRPRPDAQLPPLRQPLPDPQRRRHRTTPGPQRRPSPPGRLHHSPARRPHAAAAMRHGRHRGMSTGWQAQYQARLRPDL